MATSLAFSPNKKYKLITVLNGATRNIEAPKLQADFIVNFFKTKGQPLNVEHVYLDASEDMKKYVIDTAKKDRNTLGAPAVCSGCKIIMEKNMWSYVSQNETIFSRILKKRRNPILMGYNANQSSQNWIEQTKLQMDIMSQEAKKRNVNLRAPFFNVLEEPFDSTLLLSSLGIPLKNHKMEMKCALGGLNPIKLGPEKQMRYTILKNNETAGIYNKKVNVSSSLISAKLDLTAAAQDLRAQQEFIKGAFKEEKFKGQYGEERG